MLARFFSNQLVLGAAQAAVAGLLAVALMFVARARHIHIERETLVSLLRGLVQIVLVGSVLVFVLRGPLLISLPILLFMMAAAGVTAARRAQGIPGAGWVSFYAITAGAGLVIVLMTFLGVINWSLDSLIPVGSMLIANSMNTSALALDRFRAEVVAHRGQVEAALALGATPQQSVAPYVVESVRSSLIPRVEFDPLAGHRVDPGLDGRYDPFRHRPSLRGPIPVRDHGHDLCFIQFDEPGEYLFDPAKGVRESRPVDFETIERKRLPQSWVAGIGQPGRSTH